jgi:hypothetical protein
VEEIEINSTRKIVVFGLSGLKSVESDLGDIVFYDDDFDIHLADFDIIIYWVGAFAHSYERGSFHQTVLKKPPIEAIRRENEISLALERGKTVCIIGINSED